MAIVKTNSRRIIVSAGSVYDVLTDVLGRLELFLWTVSKVEMVWYGVWCVVCAHEPDLCGWDECVMSH